MLRMIRTSALLRRSYPSLVWQNQTTEKAVFLTFDDGPTPEVTEFVLKELGKHSFKACFFCIGKNVIQNETLLKALLDEGHSIGNHTFSHVNGWRTSNFEYLNEIDKTQTILEERGVKTDLFRPPYGKITRKQIQLLRKNWRIIMWDLLSYDWDHRFSPINSFNKLKMYTRPGSIIVFHDSEKAFPNLKRVLPMYLNFLKTEGYQAHPLK